MGWRDNRGMDRYVFYAPQALDRKVVTAAKKTATSLGATVVRAVAGSMLVEAAPAKIAQVAKALPGWRYSAEKKVHRIPERTPLQRAHAARSVKKAA
jgi:hypothetical protein